MAHEGVNENSKNTEEPINGEQLGAFLCPISIDNLSAADHGKWTCRVYHTEGKQWQEAHVQVGAKEDINVRLPSNIKPSIARV